jgi:hypothetical protein
MRGNDEHEPDVGAIESKRQVRRRNAMRWPISARLVSDFVGDCVHSGSRTEIAVFHVRMTTAEWCVCELIVNG